MLTVKLTARGHHTPTGATVRVGAQFRSQGNAEKWLEEFARRNPAVRLTETELKPLK